MEAIHRDPEQPTPDPWLSAGIQIAEVEMFPCALAAPLSFSGFVNAAAWESLGMILQFDLPNDNAKRAAVGREEGEDDE